MVDIVNVVVETKQKRGRKPKNANIVNNVINVVVEEKLINAENDNNIIFSIQETKNL